MSEIVKFLMSVHDPRGHRKVHHLLSFIQCCALNETKGMNYNNEKES